MNSRLLFPQDKNYILKEAQERTQSELLTDLTKSVREIYLQKYNPLGLVDDTIRAIKNCSHPSIENLVNFYHELAGVYRYKVGSNQLEFIFSGKSHYEKYLDDWKEAFYIWIEDFICSPFFIKAVLEASILHPKDRTAHLASNRLKVYLSQYFQLKVYKYRGILPTKAA